MGQPGQPGQPEGPGRPARLAVMAKPHKRRTPPPLSAIRPDLTAPLFDPMKHKMPAFEGLDVEPLLIAVRVGALDHHLEQLAAVVNERFAALDALAEIAATRHLRVGGRARLGHNLRPQYLHGRIVTVIAKEGEKWVVRLDEPVGRFTDADIRLYARQLEPV